jgi:hypothetical protein
MRAISKTSVIFAIFCTLGAFDQAAAKNGKRHAPAAQAPAADPNAIPLPENLTTNKDFLDDGAATAAQPNRLLRSQEDFSQQDPLRHTEMDRATDQFR